MLAIGSVVQKILNTTTDWRMRLVTNWPHIVGAVAEHACIERIDGETLIVGVHNAAWLQELYLLSPVLQQKINQSLDKPYIRHIKFRYRKRHTVTQRATQENHPAAHPRPLNQKELAALNALSDKELGVHLRNFLARCQSGKKV